MQHLGISVEGLVGFGLVLESRDLQSEFRVKGK